MFQYNSFAFSILNFLYWIKFILKRKLTPLRPKKKALQKLTENFPIKVSRADKSKPTFAILIISL